MLFTSALLSVRHQVECSANYSISVLAIAADAKDLRFKEATLIRRLRPTLNRREEFVDVESLTAFHIGK